MRLICPRCGAQYEIDEAAIPAAGRDVECSACDHVWRATRAGAEAAALQTQTAPVAAGHDAALATFDPVARPPLSRKLDDSVLEILREEAARELDARAAERNAQRATQRTADALARIGASRRPYGDGFEARLDDDGSLSAGVDRAEGNAHRPEPSLGAGATDESAPAPRIAPNDRLSNETAAEVAAAALAAATPDAAQAKMGDEPSPSSAPRPGSAGGDLPAASALAKAGTAPIAAPAASAPPAGQSHPTAAPAFTDPRLNLASTAQPRPTAAQRARRRHDAGFHLALMVALIAVALYALAPRLADQGRAGEALMRWQHQVNESRDWLADHADRLLAPLKDR